MSNKIGITTATKKIRALTKRIRIVQGGSSASKTFSIIMYLIDYAQRDKKPTLTSVVSESLPHLKRGAIMDFLNILKQLNRFNEESWNKSDFTYTFETGSKIEFFSIDQPRKVRGPRRDRLFINEANNTPFESFEQLEIRTKEFILLDYNPTNEFWVHDELIGKRTDIDFIILTYKDNEALDQSIVESLEQRKNRPSWWKVYGEGQLGEVEGRVYTDWSIIDEIPHEARLERHGIDFGYVNDPTTVIDIYYYNGGYILDEVVYSVGMKNRDIANALKNMKQCICVADSAEPKSIAEIKEYGITIIGAIKGQDSKRYGIQTMQDQRISVTKRSINLIKEYRNYLWAVDKEGREIIGETEGADDCLDACRYAMTSLIPVIQRNELYMNMPRLFRQPKKNPAR